MALTLPNNLVFVPLDVLTAEELNQLMANITFLANQFPLAASNIGAKAVTSPKIDWSTLPQSASNPNSSYVQIGPLLVCWGETTKTIPNMAAMNESMGDPAIVFPKAYTSTPKVMLQAGDIGGVCGEYTVVVDVTTTSFRPILGHTGTALGTTGSVSWIAIGISA